MIFFKHFTRPSDGNNSSLNITRLQIYIKSIKKNVWTEYNEMKISERNIMENFHRVQPYKN